MRDSNFKVEENRFRLDIRKIFFHHKMRQGTRFCPEQLWIPGNVHIQVGWCFEQSNLMQNISIHRLVPSNPISSVILAELWPDPFPSLLQTEVVLQKLSCLDETICMFHHWNKQLFTHNCICLRWSSGYLQLHSDFIITTYISNNTIITVSSSSTCFKTTPVQNHTWNRNRIDSIFIQGMTLTPQWSHLPFYHHYLAISNLLKNNHTNLLEIQTRQQIYFSQMFQTTEGTYQKSSIPQGSTYVYDFL